MCHFLAVLVYKKKNSRPARALALAAPAVHARSVALEKRD
jgi:hypothetical protein